MELCGGCRIIHKNYYWNWCNSEVPEGFTEICGHRQLTGMFQKNSQKSMGTAILRSLPSGIRERASTTQARYKQQTTYHVTEKSPACHALLLVPRERKLRASSLQEYHPTNSYWKKGVSIIYVLLQNLDPLRLCIATRLILKTMIPHVLKWPL